MTVTFLGAIGRITGVRTQTASASNVRELLEELLRRHGQEWREQVFDGTDLAHGVTVVVNGLNVGTVQGLSTPLQPGDQIVLFPPFEGG
mgnify:FL=1